MNDRRSHCHEASLYKSHERQKGTVYGYLPVVEVQIVVAWSVANMEGLPNAVIGSPGEKVAAFRTRFRPLHHVRLLYSQLSQSLTMKGNYPKGAAKLMRGRSVENTYAFRAWHMGC